MVVLNLEVLAQAAEKIPRKPLTQLCVTGADWQFFSGLNNSRAGDGRGRGGRPPSCLLPTAGSGIHRGRFSKHF